MSNEIHHPSTVIATAITDEIRQSAAEAERLRDLHPSQLKHIYRQGWFRMFIPESYGGLGWALPQVLAVEESLSWVDASTAWVVTLCSGVGWFTGFIAPALVKDIASQNVCIAGSGAATGRAEQATGGYRINGCWKYASGSLHATAFTANCILYDAGQPLRNGDGSLVVRPFLFYRDEVTIHQHWNAMGMLATGSHSFEVKDLVIPRERCFSLEAGQAIATDPVFKFPFLQLAETTLSVNMSGMAMRFLDLCDALFSKRRAANVPGSADCGQRLAFAQAQMGKCRSRFYDVMRQAWHLCETGDVIPGEVLRDLSDTSHTLAHKSRQIVDELYPYCGLTAADTTQEMNRVWRNLHTASQHPIFNSR